MLKVRAVFCLVVCCCCFAQEADSGFELRATLTAEGVLSSQLTSAPRFGSGAAAGFRAMMYPTLKLNRSWSLFGAVQVLTRPYFLEQFGTQGSGIRADVLQAHLAYSRLRKDGSVVLRIGQLSSAFGSFLLRYDDSANALTDMPLSYGYYYKGVSSYGMPGAQIDLTFRKIDGRVQWVTSSPANRRGLTDSDQYGTWSAGVGFTPTQALRIGASAYRGPYLHRQYPYYVAGEANPRDLPASAVGLDIAWARGHWTANGEFHRFTREYRAIPVFRQDAGYIESRRTLSPRWFAAIRAGYITSNAVRPGSLYEIALGYRPNSRQIIKFEYQMPAGSAGPGKSGPGLVVQVVTSLRPISAARD